MRTREPQRLGSRPSQNDRTLHREEMLCRQINRHADSERFKRSDTKSAKRCPGQLPRMDSRCLRFFYHCLCLEGHRKGIQDGYSLSDSHALPYLGDAAPGRISLRPGGRQIRAAADVNDRYYVLFGRRISVRICAILDRPGDPPRFIWYIDGGRMGRRRVADNGKYPAQNPRDCLRITPGRLSQRLLVVGRPLRNGLPFSWLARDVYGRRLACIPGAFHTKKCRRIAGLATA